MKKKKIILITIGLIILTAIITTLLVIYRPFNEKSDKKEKDNNKEIKDTFSYTPPLYEICDSDSCIYLLGAIHLGDYRVNKLSDKVIETYKKSDKLAIELDATDITIDTEYFMLDEGTIDSLIDEDFDNKLLAFQKEHLFPYESLKYFKLGYIENYLTTLAYNELGYNIEGVDSYLTRLAKKDKKKIIELESVEEQLNILIEFSDNFYIKTIEEIVDNYDLYKQEIENLYNAYIEEDYDTLKTYIDIGDTSSEDNKEYYEKFFYKRNKNMANKAKEFLKNNDKVFMTVGAAHVIGKDGIIDLLKDGYKITQIKG